MSNEQPLVSVILPCYNHEIYVAEAIESVLDQTYGNIEFIVADNGSTDRTREVIDGYQDRISKIIYMDKNDIYTCVTSLQNACSGKYIAMMHSDDFWLPDKIEKQVNALKGHPDCAACFTWASYTNENLEDLGVVCFQEINRERIEWIRKLIMQGNCLSYPSVLIDRLEMLRIRRVLYPYARLGDWSIWVELLRTYNIVLLEEPLVKMRRHDNNMSETSIMSIFRDLQDLSAVWMRILTEFTDEEFIEVFRPEFVKQNASTPEEIMCEKYFLSIRKTGKNLSLVQPVYHYFCNCFQNIKIQQTFQEVYQYSIQEFWEYTKKNSFVDTMYISVMNEAKLNKLEDYVNRQQLGVTCDLREIMDLIIANGRIITDKVQARMHEELDEMLLQNAAESIGVLWECLKENEEELRLHGLYVNSSAEAVLDRMAGMDSKVNDADVKKATDELAEYLAFVSSYLNYKK